MKWLTWLTVEENEILTRTSDPHWAWITDEALERTGYPPEKVPALIQALGATGERDYNRRLWWVRW